MKRCQNPLCKFTANCSIRLTDQPPAAPARPPGKTTLREPWKDSVQLTMRPESHGWVGILTIQGRLKKNVGDLLSGLAGDIFSMKGLLLRFDTQGGLCGPNLQALVILARQKMPVVGWVRKHCFSAGTLPLAACDAAFCHLYGKLGVFGSIKGVCDGKTPSTMVSRQSPQKWDGKAVYPWGDRSFISNGDARRIQAELDRGFERDLKQVQEYTGADPQRLRTYLDGRVLTPAEGIKIGLIDRICNENEAYKNLLRKVKKRKENL